MDDPFAPRALFAIPLYSSLIGGADEHNGPLSEEILAQRHADPRGDPRSVRGAAWHSGDAFRKSRHPSLGWVLQHCLFFAERALGARYDGWRTRTLKLRSFWANVLEKGGFHTPHHHLPRHWSGVYYVATGTGADDDGCIEFLDPHPSVVGSEPRHRHRPEAGQVLLFPSSLWHMVHPVTTDEPRITIAFNLDVDEGRRA